MPYDPNAKKDTNANAEYTFPAKNEPVLQIVRRKVRGWTLEYLPLFEAGVVAISAHILAFPIIWFLGWAMPWPKGPEITTTIEFDLTNWPEEAVPTEITDIFESHKGGAGKKVVKKVKK